MSKNVLVISHDVVGPVMAGPGIRYFHLARVLSQHVRTVLAIPRNSPDQIAGHDFSIVRYDPFDWTSLSPHVAGADICVFPSDVANSLPQLSESDACLVVDGYDPLLAEWLAIFSGVEPEQMHVDWRRRMVQLHQQYRIGDFFLCASERQRDWWLGLLESNGRINPATYQADPSLRSLVDVVAYGLPETPPEHTRQVVKGVWKGIDHDDKLLVWGGGLWTWLDPITAIRAVSNVYRVRQDVRLIFPGTLHPNSRMAEMSTHLQRAREIADQEGLLDTAVFFGDWVPYGDWANLLMECDLALSLHFDTLETRLAFRSRVLEYIWAGLPIVASQGDATSELIQHYELGRLVECENVTEVSIAILNLLEQPRGCLERQFAQARQALTWERAAEPLARYCKNPRRAADRPTDLDTGSRFYYPNLGEQLRHEREHWQALVAAYENGRVIRAMKWGDQVKRRFLTLSK